MTRGIPTDASDAMFRRPDGEPYLPSNGTEGSIFMAHWCEQCQKDQFHAGGDSCPILLNALCSKQPEEWRYQEGVPVCTAFEEVEKTSVEFTHPRTGQVDRHECPILESRKGLALIERIDGRLSITHVASGLMVHRWLLFEADERDEALAAFEKVFPLTDWTRPLTELATSQLEAEILATCHEGA